MEKEKRNQILRVLLLLLICVAIFFAIYLPLKLTGVLDKISSVENLKEIILSGGGFSYLIFFGIQFLQTTILPIPAFVTTSVGSIIFGPWIGSIISLLAVLCGSMFAFFLGRKLGRKAVYKIVGEESSKKWLQKLEKGKYVFFLMMLFPIFPDDILCILAGVTPMTFKFFLITNLISRPISIIATAFFGGGYLIPFSGWGIPVWIVFIILAIIAFFVTIKYQEKIESVVVAFGEKLGKKKGDAVIKGKTNANRIETDRKAKNNNEIPITEGKEIIKDEIKKS